MKKRVVAAGVGLGALFGLWLWNTSMLASPGPAARQLVAHRGVHQPIDQRVLDPHACTATSIAEPVHGFIENTRASVQAAVDAGASRVEIDIRRTADGALVVFHDDGLDCRTDGAGRVRDATLAELRALDLGYGYTHDGVTFPLRGQAVGEVMTLEEVLVAFPDLPLLVDVKGGDPDVAGPLVEALRGRQDVWMLAQGEVLDRVEEELPEVRVLRRSAMKGCLTEYLGLGWSGAVPEACRGQVVPVPANVAPWVWGWPHRFTRRLHRVGAEPMVVGPWYPGEGNARGVDEVQMLEDLGDYQGAVLTNRVEVLGAVDGW